MTPIADEQLRQAITAVEGVELVDEDYEDVVDVVLMWFGRKTATSLTRWSMP